MRTSNGSRQEMSLLGKTYVDSLNVQNMRLAEKKMDP